MLIKVLVDKQVCLPWQQYTKKDGREVWYQKPEYMEIEVPDDEITPEFLEYHNASQKEQLANNLKNERRHTSLATFEYEDQKFFTSSNSDIEFQTIGNEIAGLILSCLNAREKRIMELSLQGYTNKDIAQKEGVTPQRIGSIIAAAKNKMRIFISNNPSLE